MSENDHAGFKIAELISDIERLTGTNAVQGMEISILKSKLSAAERSIRSYKGWISRLTHRKSESKKAQRGDACAQDLFSASDFPEKAKEH